MSTPAAEQRPTFRAVKEALRKKGFDWTREPLFPNDDLLVGRFRGTSNGRRVWASGDYEDDERIEPEILTNICRALELDGKDLSVECDDGTRISAYPGHRPTPVPPVRN